MLLTALPPAPPTPSTVIRGLSSVVSGVLKLIVMSCLRECAPEFHVFRPTPRERPSCFSRPQILHPNKPGDSQRARPRRSTLTSVGGLGSCISGGLVAPEIKRPSAVA